MSTTEDILMYNNYTLGSYYIGDPADTSGDTQGHWVTHDYNQVMSLTEITNAQFVEVMKWGIRSRVFGSGFWIAR
jgi:hypothetical protein